MSETISRGNPPRPLLTEFCQRFGRDEVAVRRRLDAPGPHFLGDGGLSEARREARETDFRERQIRLLIRRLIDERLDAISKQVQQLCREVQALHREQQAMKREVATAIADMEGSRQ